MKLQQLRYFCQVVKNDFNITHAAAALYTSQPGVSKQLKLLEQQLGIGIFMRSGQKILGLTEAGKEVFEIARQILMSATQLQEVAQRFSDRDSGQLIVATTHLHARYSLLPVIEKFSKRYPHVQLALIQSSPDEIDALLVDGKADIGISTNFGTEHSELVRLQTKTLYRCLITPKSHPLLRKRKPSLHDIAQYPLIVYDSRLNSGRCVLEAFEEKGIKPNIVLTAVDADVIKAYVTAGLGVAILQELAYEKDRDIGLYSVPVRHLFPPMETNVCLNRAKYLRQFAFDFITLFEPRWQRESVRNALNR
ncbi:LysR substrate-binding domain-containing protein [Candidimonas nitroreducens]|uniref:Transcriptional regulator CysB n=1 Tax=Candidimonas nitroreducens TaxID=683354 RepID=A0A225MBS9_9BURK|nr:LysR substrate-binding domain-containing protein [Candidimonas nitroreducens]OWT57600.1 transcriptional regulator CysB [Candidimonas nitroreducens]